MSLGFVSKQSAYQWRNHHRKMSLPVPPPTGTICLVNGFAGSFSSRGCFDVSAIGGDWSNEAVFGYFNVKVQNLKEYFRYMRVKNVFFSNYVKYLW